MVPIPVQLKSSLQIPINPDNIVSDGDESMTFGYDQPRCFEAAGEMSLLSVIFKVYVVQIARQNVLTVWFIGREVVGVEDRL